MAGENKIGIMPVPKLVISKALPLMLSLLVQSLSNIVDGIFVAKISEEAFTATSLQTVEKPQFCVRQNWGFEYIVAKI